jgi:hypothetical protein
MIPVDRSEVLVQDNERRAERDQEIHDLADHEIPLGATRLLPLAEVVRCQGNFAPEFVRVDPGWSGRHVIAP